MLVKTIALGEDDTAGNGAGIYARFYDAEGNAIPGSSSWVGSISKIADVTWQQHKQVFAVPERATVLELHIILRSAAGEVLVDDVQVVPLTLVK